MKGKFGSFFSTHKTFSLSVLFLVMYSMTLAFAIPNKYTPGETLDPGCAPGTQNCTVDIQGGGGSQWNDINGGINYANGNVGIGTTTPTSKLDVNGGITGKSLVINGDSITTTITVGNATNAQAIIDYTNPDALYTADGSSHDYRVYAFKNVAGGERIYSQNYAAINAPVVSNTSGDIYAVNVTWDAVSGADGYRVLTSNQNNNYTFDYSFDVGTNSLVDDNCYNICASGDSTVTPTSSSSTAFDGEAAVINGTSRTSGSVSIGTFDPSNTLETTANGKVVSAGGMKFNGQNGQNDPTAVSTTSLLWYPARSAFRASTFAGINGYDETTFGDFSTAFGQNTIASGKHSMAFGYNSTASANGSTSFGYNSVASGAFSTAFGGEGNDGFGGILLTTASGQYATAFGQGTLASGNFSTSFGNNTLATRDGALAYGFHTTASGDYSTAFGGSSQDNNGNFTFNTASQIAATAFGGGTTASGGYATSFGIHTLSDSTGSTAFGLRTSVTSQGQFGTAFGISSTASSTAATAFGQNTIASGISSLAFGADYNDNNGVKHTTASNGSSTAFGFGTQASGSAATSFGIGTIAQGSGATSFGITDVDYSNGATITYTTASSDGSTAFGIGTHASGSGSTSFGRLTVASSNQATAFGDSTTASNWNATAFGFNTAASAQSATAFGVNTASSGENALAFGYSTQASGFFNSTAFGSGSISSGNGSTAFGLSSTASASQSTAFGYNTSATYDNATAFGYNTLANSPQSVSFGYNTQAKFDNATAFGMNAIASGPQTTAFGYYTSATFDSATAFGSNSTASGTDSLAFGHGSVASTNGATAFGLSSHATGLNTTAFGDTTLASNYNAVSFGSNSTASAMNALAFGDHSTASGFANSTAFGSFTIASGTNALAFGYQTSAISAFNTTAFGDHTTASEDGATAFGYTTTASNYNATAFGDHTTASGSNSTATGYYTTAGGDNSFVFGDHTVTANGNSNSLAFGGYNVGNADSILEIGVGGMNEDTNDVRNAVTVKKNVDFGIGTSSFTSLFHVAQQVKGYGQVTITIGTPDVVGTDTEFTNTFKVGDAITIDDGSGPETHNVLTITDDTHMTINTNWIADGTYSYTIAGGDRFTVKGNGYVGIGTNAPAYMLDVGSSSVLTGTPVAHFATAGGTCTITPSVTGGITCSSDVNLKKNISTLLDNSTWSFNSNISAHNMSTLDKVLALTPVAYNWNIEKDTDAKHAGFIAQEVEQIFPDLVSTDPLTHLKSLNYAGFVPYTVQAIKEMNMKINALQAFVPQTLGQHVSNAFAYIESLAVGTLKVGSSAKPTGITLYDKANGNPYCLSIVNGGTQTTAGECTTGSSNNGGGGSAPADPEPTPDPVVPVVPPADPAPETPVVPVASTTPESPVIPQE